MGLISNLLCSWIFDNFLPTLFCFTMNVDVRSITFLLFCGLVCCAFRVRPDDVIRRSFSKSSALDWLALVWRDLLRLSFSLSSWSNNLNGSLFRWSDGGSMAMTSSTYSVALLWYVLAGKLIFLPTILLRACVSPVIIMQIATLTVNEERHASSSETPPLSSHLPHQVRQKHITGNEHIGSIMIKILLYLQVSSPRCTGSSRWTASLLRSAFLRPLTT